MHEIIEFLSKSGISHELMRSAIEFDELDHSGADHIVGWSMLRVRETLVIIFDLFIFRGCRLDMSEAMFLKNG